MTHASIAVIRSLMDDPTGRHWGYELGRQARVRSGVLYPILRRMTDAGWLTDGWEEPSEVGSGRPPRRYYRLTGNGARACADVLREAQADARFVELLGGLA